MRILTAGLDATTVAFLRDSGSIVEEEGVEDAEDLQSWLTDGLFDASVIDLDVTNIGVYAARQLRTNKIATPIIGISRGNEDRSWAEQRAVFLENGGDDLIRGPPNPRELLASLRAVTRRFKGALLDVFEHRLGDATLKVNLTSRVVSVNDLALHLTGSELRIMLALAASPGRVLSKEKIMDNVYTGGVDDEPEMKIIDVFVCTVRAKLESVHPDAVGFIETVWGRGYRLPDPPPPPQKEKAA